MVKTRKSTPWLDLVKSSLIKIKESGETGKDVLKKAMIMAKKSYKKVKNVTMKRGGKLAEVGAPGEQVAPVAQEGEQVAQEVVTVADEDKEEQGEQGETDAQKDASGAPDASLGGKKSKKQNQQGGKKSKKQNQQGGKSKKQNQH